MVWHQCVRECILARPGLGQQTRGHGLVEPVEHARLLAQHGLERRERETRPRDRGDGQRLPGWL